MTARYNGYFNADVLLTESLLALENANEDNYNKVLELYPYMGAEDVGSEKANLDLAMEKVSVVVNLHRVSDWTDDCYLLLGQAQFAKRNYEDAQQTFEFMAAEFSPKTIASKKKKSRGKGKVSKRERKKDVKKKNKEVKKKKAARKKSNAKKPGAKKKKKKKKKRSAPGSGKKKRKRPTAKKPAPKKEITTPKTTQTKPKPKPKSSTETKKKAKEEEEEAAVPEDDGDGRINHRPVWQDSKLWLAQTYIQREMFSEANYILEELTNDPKLFKELKKDLAKVMAFFYLKRKDFNPAVTALEKVFNLSKDRKEKARVAFILGQLNQKLDQQEASIAYFDKASKISPNYELAFSAKLQIAQSEWLTGRATGEVAIKKLKGMLKDDKNRTYKDQIYFAMGQIALKEKDDPGAITYFKQSLAAGSENKSQKSESYLALAYLYNDAEEFVAAKSYFDSTLTVLAKSDERLETVESYRDNLEEIAQNIQIIELQDSLLTISKMDPETQAKVALKIKAERDSLALLASRNSISRNQRSQSSGVRDVRGGPNANAAPFWPYDTRALRKGERDFQKKFGNRLLEDDWRRSKRQYKGYDASEEDEAPIVQDELSQEDIDKILSGVPKTADAIKESEAKIAAAMLRLGSLYREKLNRLDLAIDILQQLADDHPGNIHEAEGWYQLYIAYKDDGQMANAKIYQRKISEQYPSSVYAQILGDPEYMTKAGEKMKELSNYYDATYAKFVSHDYEAVNQRIKTADEKFPKPHKMQAKFALLDAMTKGHIEGKEAYVKLLKEVVAKYPKTEEEKRAKEILRLLGEGQVAGVRAETPSGTYSLDMEQVHYFVIAIKNNSVKLADAKAKVSDFHREFYKLDRLRISNIYLGTDTSTPILVIRRFKSGAKAMAYFNDVDGKKSTFLGDGAEFEMFAVSQSNYRQILRSKTLDGYREFFDDNYK